jgi:hypothetical protein
LRREFDDNRIVDFIGFDERRLPLRMELLIVEEPGFTRLQVDHAGQKASEFECPVAARHDCLTTRNLHQRAADGLSGYGIDNASCNGVGLCGVDTRRLWLHLTAENLC